MTWRQFRDYLNTLDNEQLDQESPFEMEIMTGGELIDEAKSSDYKSYVMIVESK